MKTSFQGSFNNMFSKLSNLEDAYNLAENVNLNVLNDEESESAIKDLIDCSGEMLLGYFYLAIYHDVILGLIKGDCNLQQVKDFMFSGMSDEDVSKINYEDGIVFDKNTDKGEDNE